MAVLLLVSIPSPCGAESATNRWAAFAPDITVDSASQRLSEVLGLNPTSSIYVFHEGIAAPKRIVVSEAQWIGQIDVAGTSGFIAATIIRAPVGGSQTVQPGHAVTVIDTLGRELARFLGAHRFRWSPDGSRLGLWFATPRPEKYSQPDSIGVWDAGKRKLKILHVRPYDIGWIDPDLIALDYWRYVQVLDLRNDEVTSTPFKGTLASPDQAFSISDRYESGVHVWDERTHEDISGPIEGLLEGGDLRAYPEPFWVQSPRSGHLLCVSACSYWEANRKVKKPPYDCNVYVVDPETMTVVKRIRGKGIGPSADKRAVVTLRGRTVRFVDLLSGPD